MRIIANAKWSFLLCFFLAFLGCEKDAPDFITLSGSVFEFEAAEGNQPVMIESSKGWLTSVDEDWVLVKGEEDGSAFTIYVTENTSSIARSAVVRVEAGEAVKEIDVLQAGVEQGLALTENEGVVYDTNTFYCFGVKTKNEWTVSVEGNWIDIEAIPDAKEGDALIGIRFNKNLSKTTRTAKVTISTADHQEVFELTQHGHIAESVAQDSLALVALHKSLKLDQLNNDHNWDLTKPMKTWKGITLTDAGRVEQILLTQQLLPQGSTLAPQIKYLGELKNLFLGQTGVGNNQGFPHEMARLTKLSSLVAGNSSFGADLPAWLCAMTSLTEIRLEASGVTGELPWELVALNDINHLALGNNEVEGELPAIWGHVFPTFSYIDLRRNKLYGEIPASWGSMKLLVFFDLSHNAGMDGDVPGDVCDLFQIGSLQNFYLDGTDIVPCH